MESWVIWVIVGVALVLFMIWSTLSNKKRVKQMNDMHTTLRVGDEIMTIGGIVGKIVEVRETSPVDKEFVIETGIGDRKTTMLFDLRALHENRTRMREIQAEAARAAELARLEREAKKSGAVITNSAADESTTAELQQDAQDAQSEVSEIQAGEGSDVADN